jgi:hypothetical protein
MGLSWGWYAGTIDTGGKECYSDLRAMQVGAPSTTPLGPERRTLDRDLQPGTKAISALDPDAAEWQNLYQLTTDLVTLDLLSFFNANPYACVTSTDVALCIGRHERQVRPSLDRLAEAQILDAIPVLDLLVYQLASRDEIRRLVKHFVMWFGESFFWGRRMLRPPPPE